MSRFQRWTILGVAIFCLLIFSVTGPMMQAISGVMAEGPGVWATLDLPSGPAEITSEDYRRAQSLLFKEGQIMGRRSPEVDTEEVLAYATLIKLADEFEVAVVRQDLEGFIRYQFAVARTSNYEDIYRRFGFRNGADYENVVSALIRQKKVEEILSASVIVTSDQVREDFASHFEEIKCQYMVLTADDFAGAASSLEPTDEEFTTFFEGGLTPVQMRDLENEESVSWEALLLTADALATEAVKAWAPSEEPSPEALEGFYNYRRYSHYLRPDSEEGADPDPEAGPTLSMEELGDRLGRDFCLHRAALTLSQEAADGVDLSAFAGEKGVELLAETQPVPRSQLADLPRIGTAELGELFRGETGQWLPKAILVADLAFVIRPTEIQPRAMPPVEEIRDSVVDFWREGKREDLARDAARAFLDGLPKPEGHIAGDPVIVDEAAFAAASSAAGEETLQLDWIARRPRPVIDPLWEEDEKIQPWLRIQVGRQLDDLLDGQAAGPYEFSGGARQILVRLEGRRPADPDIMWPGEMAPARARSNQEALRRFNSDSLSYEGLARAWNIQRTLDPAQG